MTTNQPIYSVVTTFKGGESNPYENRAKSLEDGERMFADFTKRPEADLIEVELVEITDEAKSLKIWNRE